MKNKKIVLGSILFLFVMIGICNISHAWTDEFTLDPLSRGWYALDNLSDGDTIHLNEIRSSGIINVYIMNEEQHTALEDSGGVVWTYLIRWQDITYLSGYEFDITTDDNYYIVFYNKDIFVGRTIQVDIFIEEVYNSIYVTSPKLFDICLIGYNNITWTSTGDIGLVSIELYRNGIFIDTITSWTFNDGFYEYWYIDNGEYVDGFSYQIKITDYNNAFVYDYSDDFTIDCGYNTITVTNPMSTDIFETGNNPIKWTSAGEFDYVVIELYKDGYFLETISTLVTDNDGFYTWHIYDDEYIDDSDYQIKISDYYDTSVYDYSDYFTIECEIDIPIPDLDPDDPIGIPSFNLLIVIGIIGIIATISIITLRKKINK